MTDGILLNEIMSDRLLNKYSLIMIDEAHERSLNIDFLLGYIKKILPKRPDLKVIISSATIDTEKFSKFYNNATIISVSGRLFPVETLYLPIDEMEIKKGRTTYVDLAVNAVNEIISMEDEGDILVFMPTEKDITETVQILEGRLKNSCEILPLFARLTRYQQNKIFSTYNNRKVVISTNIAETSLTVPGIKFVVDTGLARIKDTHQDSEPTVYLLTKYHKLQQTNVKVDVDVLLKVYAFGSTKKMNLPNYVNMNFLK